MSRTFAGFSSVFFSSKDAKHAVNSADSGNIASCTCLETMFCLQFENFSIANFRLQTLLWVY